MPRYNEGTPHEDVDLSVRLIECIDATEASWQEVARAMESLKTKRLHTSAFAAKITDHVMSTLPYITALLESADEDNEDIETKAAVITDAYALLETQRIGTIKDIFETLTNPPQPVERINNLERFTQLLEDSDSTAEAADRIHSEFVSDITSDINKIFTSPEILRKAKQSEKIHVVANHAIDVAKIAGGTALGFIIANRLSRRR